VKKNVLCEKGDEITRFDGILHYEFAQNELKVWYKSLLRLSVFISISSSNSYQTSEKLRLIGIRIPTQASRHSDKKPQTHEPGWNGCPSIPDEFRGFTIKIVIKDGILSLRTTGPRWYGPDSRHSISLVYSDALDAELPLHKKSSSPIRSGGGDPYRMVRIQSESGVRIKILESGFRNPDPYAFALVLV
jgi:hypothetical protein